MKIAMISITRNGEVIAKKIGEFLRNNHDCVHYCHEKYPCPNAVHFSSLKELIRRIFEQYDALIFVCACGIAVRMIAPHIVVKTTDPAVIAVDEQGKFAVSLLSGHIGRANALTEQIAAIIGAVPVITTATDTGGKFSPDSFAVANRLHIVELDAAKAMAAAVVNGEPIGFYSEYPYENVPRKFFDNNKANIGICIAKDTAKNPFETTLHLIPKNIVIGVGCKRNTPPETMEHFLLEMLSAHEIPPFRVTELHTIDIKKDERALLEFCQKYGIVMKTYSANELMNIDGHFSPSDFVMKTTGADNICERSAAANGARLIVRKTVRDGMTFAAAEQAICVDFERKMI